MTSGRDFSEVVRLVADVGDAKLGGRKERMREMAGLIGQLQRSADRARRDAAALERLGARNLSDQLAQASRDSDKRERAEAAKRGRAIAEESKRARAMLGSQITYLDSNRATGAMLAAIGVEMDAAERRRAKEVDRANAALRNVLARLIEAIDDNIDITLAIASRLDPDNDAPTRSLADVEAAYPGAAE